MKGLVTVLHVHTSTRVSFCRSIYGRLNVCKAAEFEKQKKIMNNFTDSLIVTEKKSSESCKRSCSVTVKAPEEYFNPAKGIGVAGKDK